jgi:hypothetical protein
LGTIPRASAGFMAGIIPRVEAARSAATRGGGLAELSGRQCDDERADDDLKTGGTAEWAELGVLCMVPGADRAAHDFGFGGFVFGDGFHGQSPGQEARMRLAMARASSHIWAGSCRVQISHNSVAE